MNVQPWGEALVKDRIRDSFLDDFATYRGLLADAVGRAQHDGALDPDLDPDLVAHVLWGLYLGMEVQKAWDPELDTHAYAERDRSSLRRNRGCGRQQSMAAPPPVVAGVAHRLRFGVEGESRSSRSSRGVVPDGH